MFCSNCTGYEGKTCFTFAKHALHLQNRFWISMCRILGVWLQNLFCNHTCFAFLFTCIFCICKTGFAAVLQVFCAREYKTCFMTAKHEQVICIKLVWLFIMQLTCHTHLHMQAYVQFMSVCLCILFITFGTFLFHQIFVGCGQCGSSTKNTL